MATTLMGGSSTEGQEINRTMFYVITVAIIVAILVYLAMRVEVSAPVTSSVISEPVNTEAAGDRQ